ncbi:MAG: hypothetical protein JW894_04900 [Bacteroidales bacterium]|nr:hypothetical protein [Bacteroidales bacterium]
MRIFFKIVLLISFVIIVSSCLKKDYDIEYQEGYPNSLAGIWIAFEFQGGTIEGNFLSPAYELVTSLDPNVDSSLILDKLYNSDTRVRAHYRDSTFCVEMGEQLEYISEDLYNISYISVDGYVTTNPILIDLAYQMASIYFEGVEFEPSDIEDVIFMHAGYYDEFRYMIDTVLLIGYRKTGFEEVSY